MRCVPLMMPASVCRGRDGTGGSGMQRQAGEGRGGRGGLGREEVPSEEESLRARAACGVQRVQQGGCAAASFP